MEFALEILSSWATNCNIDINPNKTHLVLFSHMYKIETFSLTSLAAKELPLTSDVKCVERTKKVVSIPTLSASVGIP